ncbi:MAG: hypothetical protein AAFX44_00365 [Pseudomonadota bacterium]
MLATVRMFESAENARRALDKLDEEDLIGDGAWIITSEPSRLASETVAEAIEKEQLPSYFQHVARRALERGHSVVSVKPVFGVGRIVERTLDEFGTVNSDELPEYLPPNPAPLSDFLGWPTLASYQYTFNAKQITSRTWFLTTGRQGRFLLKPNRPWLPGMTIKRRPPGWPWSMFLPALGKPKPFLPGMKIKRRPAGWPWSVFLPTLVHNPAPLSNLFNLPLLSKRDDKKDKK